MFAKKNRFSFKKGAPKYSLNSKFFVLRYDFDANALECSVVIGKKVDKRAVARNRLKRKIVQKIRELIDTDKKLRLVIYIRKGLNEDIFSEFEIDLEKNLKDKKII